MKAGDIAITWAPDGISEFRGLFVELISPTLVDSMHYSGPGWMVRGQVHCERVCAVFAQGFGHDGESASASEWVMRWPTPWLRPLGNPDRHAVDEMVQIARQKAPSPEFVGQTFYEPTQPPGFVGV
jgi:hypothetical protein